MQNVQTERKQMSLIADIIIEVAPYLITTAVGIVSSVLFWPCEVRQDEKRERRKAARESTDRSQSPVNC